MDEKVSGEMRERVTRWIEDTQQMLALLPDLFEAAGQLSVRTNAAEQECERLRKELEEIPRLRQETEELKRENQHLRAERDEISQAFAKLMETVQPMNQIAQKLGLKKSPFEREPRPGPGAPAGEGGKPTT